MICPSEVRVAGGRRYNEQRLCGLAPQRSPHRRFTNTPNLAAKAAIVQQEIAASMPAEVAQTTVDPRALDHLDNGDAALLVEGDVGNAAGLGGGEIGAAGVATIGGGLPRRCAGAGNMAIEHRHIAFGIRRIAGFDDDIEVSPLLPVARLSLCPY